MNPLRIGAVPPSIPLNVAHRGARAFAPENTLPAFAKAIAHGCPMFEVDVHMSKDGVLVVHHDDDLTRCTDVALTFPGRGPSYVSDFTYQELRTLDAGSWFVDQLSRPPAMRQPFLESLTDQEIEAFVSADDRRLYASGAVQIPTLRETLELGQRHGVMVDIELKTLPRMYGGLADAVMDVVMSMQMQDRVLISSFDHEQLVGLRARSDAVALGVLTSDRIARAGDYLHLLGADVYLPCGSGEYDSLGFGSASGELDATSIRGVRAMGGQVMAWTCNDAEHVRRLLTAGVAGVITDYPNRVQQVLGVASRAPRE